MFKFCEYLKDTVVNILPASSPKETDTMVTMGNSNGSSGDNGKLHERPSKSTQEVHSADDGEMYTSIGAKRVMMLAIVTLILGLEPVAAVKSFGYPVPIEYFSTGFGLKEDILVREFNCDVLGRPAKIL